MVNVSCCPALMVPVAWKSLVSVQSPEIEVINTIGVFDCVITKPPGSNVTNWLSEPIKEKDDGWE